LTGLFTETFYWFGDNDYEEFGDLFEEYIPPPYRLPNMNGIYSFGLAGIYFVLPLLNYTSLAIVG
jgi:hypothetical protein